MHTNINDFKKSINENIDSDEQLYHEIDWNDLENKFTEFSSTYNEADYAVMRQTFNFLKEEIVKYKMLM